MHFTYDEECDNCKRRLQVNTKWRNGVCEECQAWLHARPKKRLIMVATEGSAQDEQEEALFEEGMARYQEEMWHRYQHIQAMFKEIHGWLSVDGDADDMGDEWVPEIYIPWGCMYERNAVGMARLPRRSS